jgi:hypothetical protein
MIGPRGSALPQESAMLRRSARWLAVPGVILAAALVFGMGGTHPKDRKIVHPQWPEGLADVVNFAGRVHGHWVNANDEFFYRGDTRAFNDFLKRYAKVKDTPLRVVIHGDRRRRSRLWGDEPKIPYDWKLLLLRRGWGAPPASSGTPGNYVVTIDVWVDGQVDLDEIYLFGWIAPLVAPAGFGRD